MKKYSYKFENERYTIYEDDNILKTPYGYEVCTLYKPLAERIILDIECYGKDYHSIESILAWHYTVIDIFYNMKAEQIDKVLIDTFLKSVDWTFLRKSSNFWFRIFGVWNVRKGQIIQWLSKTTYMQKTAIYWISNYYRSINITFIIAIIIENLKEKDKELFLQAIAKMFSGDSRFGSFEKIYQDFKNFEFYYGFHLEESGPILSEIGPEILKSWRTEELKFEGLNKHSVSIEQLTGRNYYHYTCGKMDKNQPLAHPVGDLNLDFYRNGDYHSIDSAVYEPIYDEQQNEFTTDDSLVEYLPYSCWLKRFNDTNDPYTCYLLYLQIDEKGAIKNSGCIEETTSKGLFKTYKKKSFIPDVAAVDLIFLFHGKYIPVNFSFIGKRLPQKRIDKGGKDGDNMQYDFTLRSAYRRALLCMIVNTDEKGVIKELQYTSLQFNKNKEDDGPISYAVRSFEAMDMLVMVYDMYSDDEMLNQLNSTYS